MKTGKSNFRNALPAISSPNEVETNLQIEIVKRLTQTLAGEVQFLAHLAKRGQANNEFGAAASNGRIRFYDEVQKFEMQLIRKALMISGGSQIRSARILGMNNTTLNSLIKRYGISCEEFKGCSREGPEWAQKIGKGRPSPTDNGYA